MSSIVPSKKNIISIICLGVFFFGSTQSMALRNVKNGQALENQILSTFSGNSMDLRSISGKKATLMVFWASWSPRSIIALAEFQEIYNKVGENGDLEVIAINVEQQSPTEKQIKIAESVVKKNGITYKLAMDDKLNAYRRWGVVAVPTALLVDKKGMVIEVLDGYPPEQSSTFKSKAIEAAGIVN